MSEQADDIAAALAVEEHRQGMPYDGGWEHCAGCRHAAVLRRQAMCPHENTVEFVTFGAARPFTTVCDDCGGTVEGE